MEVDLGAGFRLTDRSLIPGYYGVVALVECTGEAWRVEELSADMVDCVVMLICMLAVEGKLTRQVEEAFNAWAGSRVEIAVQRAVV